MRPLTRNIGLIALAFAIGASLYIVGSRKWKAESLSKVSNPNALPVVSADRPATDQPITANAEVSSKQEAVEKLVQEFQDKVRHETSSSIDPYVHLVPLEQALRDDPEAFTAYQDYVYERLVNAEKPFDALEDAMLFPIVAYVDQPAAEKLLIRVIMDTQGETQRAMNAGYIQMLGDWMVSEEAVVSLLDLGERGLPGLDRALETLGHNKPALRSKIVAGVQDKLAFMQRQGQEHSPLARHYQKLLDRPE